MRAGSDDCVCSRRWWREVGDAVLLAGTCVAADVGGGVGDWEGCGHAAARKRAGSMASCIVTLIPGLVGTLALGLLTAGFFQRFASAVGVHAGASHSCGVSVAMAARRAGAGVDRGADAHRGASGSSTRRGGGRGSAGEGAGLVVAHLWPLTGGGSVPDRLVVLSGSDAADDPQPARIPARSDDDVQPSALRRRWRRWG